MDYSGFSRLIPLAMQIFFVAKRVRVMARMIEIFSHMINRVIVD